MRLSVDSKALGDPRFKRLAAALGLVWHEALGRCVPVWFACYEARSALISESDVDIIAERDGFGAAMVSSDLAKRSGRRLRICGVTERIEFLIRQSERGRMGGRGRKRSESVRFADANQTESEGKANSPDLDLDLASASPPDLASASDHPPNPPGGPSSRRKSKRSELDITEQERASALVVLGKLTERSGIAYRGSDAHLRLIAARLRGGASEMDLRAIVAYCAEGKARGGLGWADGEMRSYLRPETLFGPQNIERYLDAARTWLAELQRRQQMTDEHERRPATSSPAMPLPLRPARDDERNAS